MPELPEVETIVRELNAADLLGLKILEAHVFWPRTIATHTAPDFCRQIQGRTIAQISRRGKFIVLTLSKGALLVHLRMTGKFSLDQTPTAHVRVKLLLEDGRMLQYDDQRKFGKWYLVNKAEEKLSQLGIEPLSKQFTLPVFSALLKKSKVQAKPFLLNQQHVAGLGNIYVDEALWEAKIHPQRPIHTLNKQEVRALFAAIPKVLKIGIDSKGTSLGSHNANYFSVSGRRGTNQHKLKVFRRDGESCPRCRTKICKITVVQRGTHFCPKCQK